MVSKEEEFLSCDIYSLPKYSSGATVSDFPHFSSSTPSQTPTGPLELVELALARHPNLPMHELRCLTPPPLLSVIQMQAIADDDGCLQVEILQCK